MPHRPSEAIGKAAGLAKAAKAVITGQRGIFKKLQQEHGEVSALMARVAASSSEKVRRDLFPTIKQELLSHAKAEEKEFYAVLKRFDETKLMIPNSTAEHDDMEATLQELDGMDIAGEAWGNLFKKLVKKVQTHVREEEHDLFPKAQKVISDTEAVDIEHRFLRQKEAELRKWTH